MFNVDNGIIQFHGCSDVISACQDGQSAQVRFQHRIDLMLFDFGNICKYNMLGVQVDLGRELGVKS